MIVPNRKPHTFFCTYCGSPFTSLPEAAGQQITCPSCHAGLLAPPMIGDATPAASAPIVQPSAGPWRSPLLHSTGRDASPSKPKSVWLQALPVAHYFAKNGGYIGVIAAFQGSNVTLFHRCVSWFIASWFLFVAFFIVAYPIAVIVYTIRCRNVDGRLGEREGGLPAIPEGVSPGKD